MPIIFLAFSLNLKRDGIQLERGNFAPDSHEYSRRCLESWNKFNLVENLIERSEVLI
jgi:hypothetical protein